MKNILKKGMAFLALAALVAVVPAVKVLADEGMPAPKMPAEFDKLKSLVGTWKGTADMHGKTTDVTNTFELTSGGSAILEKVCAGSDHEMVSVYCADGGKMKMTHYCSLGNHPEMSLKKSTDSEMDFEMKGNAGIKSAKDMHMHGMDITWKDPDHITESWYLYSDGKKMSTSPFELARVK